MRTETGDLKHTNSLPAGGEAGGRAGLAAGRSGGRGAGMLPGGFFIPEGGQAAPAKLGYIHIVSAQSGFLFRPFPGLGVFELLQKLGGAGVTAKTFQVLPFVVLVLRTVLILKDRQAGATQFAGIRRFAK